MTEWLNWTEYYSYYKYIFVKVFQFYSEIIEITLHKFKGHSMVLFIFIQPKPDLRPSCCFFLELFFSVQLLSCVWLFAISRSAACRASLSFTISRSVLKLMSNESVMPSNHLILCCPPLLPPSLFPSNRVFSNESVLCIRWPKYWSFSFSISPSNKFQDWFPIGLSTWIILLSKGLSSVFSNTIVQKHQFFGTQLSLWSNCHIHTWLLEKP